ncbi:Protein F40F8.11 b [Aphelenchoides avenae]|nr:Protein F40F8.11 b [Aphelenchus avenae]
MKPKKQGGAYGTNKRQQAHYYTSPMKQGFVNRHHTKFVAISDGVEHKTIVVDPNKLECFHGYQSVFTLQHSSKITIDNEVYKSVDHYYQKMKVKDLLGIESEKFSDDSTKNFSSLAKEILKSANVSRKSIDAWRITCGVEKALLEKVRQNAQLRQALVDTGDKVIVHSYAGDDFFGTGCPIKYVKDWCTGMQKNKVSLKFRMFFPLTPETVKNVPIFAKGRNVLGVIYMILREKINQNALHALSVPLSPPSQYVEVEIGQGRPSGARTSASTVAEDTKPNGSNIDFTMDYDDTTAHLLSGAGKPI